MAIYDTMHFIRPPVSTVCIGQAASTASLLLAAGTKDLRFALPNAGIMLRQPSGGFEGQATDIMVHAREILSLKKRLNEIYVRHTGQPLKKIEEALERDYFLTAEMARDFGVVDKVIEKRTHLAGGHGVRSKPRRRRLPSSPCWPSPRLARGEQLPDAAGTGSLSVKIMLGEFSPTEASMPGSRDKRGWSQSCP